MRRWRDGACDPCPLAPLCDGYTGPYRLVCTSAIWTESSNAPNNPAAHASGSDSHRISRQNCIPLKKNISSNGTPSIFAPHARAIFVPRAVSQLAGGLASRQHWLPESSRRWSRRGGAPRWATPTSSTRASISSRRLSQRTRPTTCRARSPCTVKVSNTSSPVSNMKGTRRPKRFGPCRHARYSYDALTVRTR